MSSIDPAQGTPLRISDLVPLRRMLSQDSIVIRVGSNGSLVPVAGLPMMFLDPSLRASLEDGFVADGTGRFEQHCRQAIASHRSISFCPDPDEGSPDEVLINPVLDDNGSDVRFLVCWARPGAGLDEPRTGRSWTGLAVDAIATRYRLRTEEQAVLVEAAPWWAPGAGELVEMWPHHDKVSAVGLGHAVMETLVVDATEAAAEFAGACALRIEVPSADMLSGLVPVVHGALRASGLAPERLVMALDVELAVDPDLLPVIVHLRTMGVRIDIVGLDALTSTLHMVSDTSSRTVAPVAATQCHHGPWLTTFAAALPTTVA